MNKIHYSPKSQRDLDEIYDYINLKVKDLSKNYNIKFIDVENLNEDKNNEKIYNDIINKK